MGILGAPTVPSGSSLSEAESGRAEDGLKFASKSLHDIESVTEYARNDSEIFKIKLS